jgi:hypothetical protein
MIVTHPPYAYAYTHMHMHMHMHMHSLIRPSVLQSIIQAYSSLGATLYNICIVCTLDVQFNHPIPVASIY